MKVTVRPATPEDHLLYLRLLPELGVDDPPPDAAKWAAELAAATLVAEQGGQPVGICTWVKLEKSGHVRSLIVDPRARRGGVGRALLEAMRPYALAGAEWTGVAVENDAELVALLQAHGASVRMNIDHYTGTL